MIVARRITDETTTIKHLVDAVNGKLTIIENLDCVVVEVADTGLANVEFSVNHYLGRIPTIYFYNIDRSGLVYDSSRATWTENALTLKCSVANAALVLAIF